MHMRAAHQYIRKERAFVSYQLTGQKCKRQGTCLWRNVESADFLFVWNFGIFSAFMIIYDVHLKLQEPVILCHKLLKFMS